MKPNILLIDTPFNIAGPNDPPRIYLPIGILYLATVLKKQGYPVRIYDPKVSVKKNYNNGIYYVGDNFDRIEEKIKEVSPDFLGVSNLFSKDMNNAIEICKRAKKVNPDIITGVGGSHATSSPGDFLIHKEIDIAVMGEGEETILDIMRWLEGRNNLARIPGIAYKDNGNIKINEQRRFLEDIDSLGYPDYSLLPIEQYFGIYSRGLGPRPLNEGRRTLPLITSRGCPYRCCFCAARNLMGAKWRAYTASSVLKHIEDMLDQYNIDSVTFEDDNLTFDQRRFEEIVDGLLSLKKKIRWITPNGVRADTLVDYKLLCKVKMSGCAGLTIGVESGSQELLDKNIHKSLNLKTVIEFSKLCQKAQISINAFFIIGFPEETFSQINETLNFALMLYKKYKVFPFINFAIPLKGTKLYKTCEEGHYFTEDITSISLTESMSFRGKGKIKTESFTPELLSRLMKQFNKKIFVRSFLYALSNPGIGFKFVKLALKNHSHFKWYVFGK